MFDPYHLFFSEKSKLFRMCYRPISVNIVVFVFTIFIKPENPCNDDENQKPPISDKTSDSSKNSISSSDDKRSKLLEKNREAASRSRRRKKEELNALILALDNLETRHLALEHEIVEVSTLIDHFKHKLTLNEHIGCKCNTTTIYDKLMHLYRENKFNNGNWYRCLMSLLDKNLDRPSQNDIDQLRSIISNLVSNQKSNDEDKDSDKDRTQDTDVNQN